MNVRFNGCRVWKRIKDELGMFEFYIFPSIIVSQDRTFDIKEYPTQIKIAWLFWSLDIYLCI